MSDHDGSRWYFPTFEGLYSAKHVEQMGPAIWLYGWVLARAYAAQRDGVMAYSHREAADALGVTYRTVQLWFDRLQEHGYLTTRARHPHHLDVAVANWRSVAEWHEARTEADGIATREKPGVSSPEVETGNESGNETGKVSGNESGKKLPLSHITIKLSNYLYPSGSDERAPTLSGAFRFLLERVTHTNNEGAALQAVYRLCFEGKPPDYGYLSKIAKKVGGAGRLVELMWQLAPKPPTGDVLAYIQGMCANKDKSNGNGRSQDNDAWANMDVHAIIESNKLKGARHE